MGSSSRRPPADPPTGDGPVTVGAKPNAGPPPEVPTLAARALRSSQAASPVPAEAPADGFATAAEARTRVDQDDTFAPGTMAGRYVLLQRLGAGGAGLVYAAYDPQLDRKVAIKILREAEHGSLSPSQGQARLLREGQAMARLKHPNVLPVYDVGTLEHAGASRVFMAMELAEGGTLRAWLRTSRSRREVLTVLMAAGRGLAAAHDAGLVHRDFKPDNVLLDGTGRVFVTDFGLVRATTVEPPEIDTPTPDPHRALAEPLTREDTVLGTPGYMAPEQYRAEAADERSDQFAFCVTLYEALYGERPFAGRSFDELERAVAARALVEPPKAAGVPHWLHRVVMRGLATDRADRHPSMRALLDALADDPQRRLRRRLLVGGAVLAMVAAAFGVKLLTERQASVCRGAERKLVGIWDDDVRRRMQEAFRSVGVGGRVLTSAVGALDDYARELVQAHTDACEATRIRGEQPEQVMGLRMTCLDVRRKELGGLTALFSSADRSTAQKSVEAVANLDSLRDCADIAALTARVPPPSKPEVRLKVEALYARLAQAKALFDAARSKQALPIVDEVLAEEAPLHYDPLRARAVGLKGKLIEQLGQMEGEEGLLLQSIDAAYAGHDDAQVATAATDLAFLESYWLVKHEDAHRWIQLAKAAIARLGGSDELEAMRARYEAEIWIGQDKGEEAVKLAEAALQLAEKVWGPEGMRTGVFHGTVGAAHQAKGDLAQARAHYQRHREILEKLLGPDHPQVAVPLNNLGMVAADEKKLDEAERYYRATLTILEKAVGLEHPQVSILSSNLANTLRLQGKHDEAIALYRRSLDIDTKKFGPDYPDALAAMIGLGQSLTAQKKPGEAVTVFERALKIARGKGGASLAEVQVFLAEALLHTGDRARALELASAARELLRKDSTPAGQEILAAAERILKQR